MSQKVSIVIPTYNVEAYVYRGIESAQNQTYSNIEIVIVDDGSTDRTWDVINSYALKDSRIVAVHQENQGVSVARNLGMELASGEYFLFLDSDDWLELNTIETLMSLRENEKGCLISVGRYGAIITEDGVIEKSKPKELYENRSMEALEALCYIGSKYRLQSACYKLYEKEIIQQNKLTFDSTIHHGEDGLFVFRYLMHCRRFLYREEPLWNTLSRPGSATRSPYNSGMMTMITAVEKMIEEYNKVDEVYRWLVVYRSVRTESLLRFALRQSDVSKEDIRIMREKLRSQRKPFFSANRDVKRCMSFVFCAYIPVPMLRKILIFWERMKTRR